MVKLNSPVYGRTLFIREVDDLEEISDLLTDINQVVGLDLKGSKGMN